MPVYRRAPARANPGREPMTEHDGTGGETAAGRKPVGAAKGRTLRVNVLGPYARVRDRRTCRGPEGVPSSQAAVGFAACSAASARASAASTRASSLALFAPPWLLTIVTTSAVKATAITTGGTSAAT